jgi:signal transduction histidine kinase
MRPRAWLLLVVVVATAFTQLISVTSTVSFAYRSPSLHVAVETVAALISLLAAQLMYGRFRRSLDHTDLILMAALVLFAGSNLLFSALPAIAHLGTGAFSTWASLTAGTIAAALFAAGAFAPPSYVRRRTAAVRRVVVLCVLVLAGIAVVTAVARDWLPEAIDPSLSPTAHSRPRVVGDPVVLGLQLVIMALFAAAAIAFTRSAERKRDPLILWFAIGAALAAFARLNYFLFPSRYSEYFYTGDVLRLGFFAALLVGTVLEIRVGQRELEHAAVVSERRRLAREIHDGIAQDLAFIVQQAAALAVRARSGRVAVDVVAADIETAARRALDASRGAIAALVRPTDEPLVQALTRVAEEAAGRWDAVVQTRGVDGIELSAPTREAVLRIVGEAVTNAARHGKAKHIRLELDEQPELLVRIADDGVGFDPAEQDLAGHHGIVGMRERAEQVGGKLRVSSRPGEGTEIVLVLP